MNLRQRNSVRDKLDNTYIEFAIYGLWKINVVNLINTKAGLAKNFHIAPSELETMPMWEYELFMKALNEHIKEENAQNEGEMAKYDMNKYQKMAQNPQKMMPKMLNMNMSLPKF